MQRIPLVVLIALAPSIALSQNCRPLDEVNFARGDLFALVRGSDKPVLVSNFLFARNEIPFDDKARLIYVLDRPAVDPRFFAPDRDYAGVLAVRLVSTDPQGKERPPNTVFLKRDKVRTRAGVRREWAGDVRALTYYTYHNPKEVRASDSTLELSFHTRYTFKPGEPDRNTYADRERRSKFHFPEINPDQPRDGFAGVIASIFGWSALASGKETRFESQIKYYSPLPKEAQEKESRCVTIYPRLSREDAGELKITINDLDGSDPLLASDTWTIHWTVPPSPTGRKVGP